MDEGFPSPIESIVAARGLPSDIWPTISLQPFSSGKSWHNLRLSSSHTDAGSMSRYMEEKLILVHDKTICALEALPAAHVMGQGVLIRVRADFTAMVSIAEAASVLLGKCLSELLWILVEFIAQELRARSTKSSRQYIYISWNKEISSAEHFSRVRQEERRQRMIDGEQRKYGEHRVKRVSERIFQEHPKLAEIEKEYVELHHKFDELCSKTEQVLQLLEEAKVTAIKDNTVPTKDDQKFYAPMSCVLHIRELDGKWFIYPSALEPEFCFLIDWLELALGGRGFATSSALFSGCIRLESEERSSSKAPSAGGCWRNKILHGNILGPELPMKPPSSRHSFKAEGFTHPFPQSKDSLILSAAALWSLFDNALSRVPDCTCTLKSEGGDFIQCKEKSGSWFLWHTSSEELRCCGTQCADNVCVALDFEEPGERVELTSPCVLGWAANARTEPNSALWERLKVTAEFKKKTFKKYEIQNFQAQANLSSPLVVAPQLGGAITFSMRNYKVANSIDHASCLAREIAAAAIVLIFDERRQIHFACDGADIIEIICLKFLQDLGLQFSSIGLFSHPTALLRLETWYHSNFVTRTGLYITGDYLVREASKRLSQLLDLSRNASANDSALLYWLLEDVLLGNSGTACKAPRTKEASWHELASKYPPLILSVGELDARLLNEKGFPLKWMAAKKESNSETIRLSGLKELLSSHSQSAGIVGSRTEIERWLFQARSFYKAGLEETKNLVSFGKKETDSEHAYKLVPYDKEKTAADGVFATCNNCPPKGTRRCLHYIE